MLWEEREALSADANIFVLSAHRDIGYVEVHVMHRDPSSGTTFSVTSFAFRFTASFAMVFPTLVLSAVNPSHFFLA